jgi:hypothetical protein
VAGLRKTAKNLRRASGSDEIRNALPNRSLDLSYYTTQPGCVRLLQVIPTGIPDVNMCKAWKKTKTKPYFSRQTVIFWLSYYMNHALCVEHTEIVLQPTTGTFVYQRLLRVSAILREHQLLLKRHICVPMGCYWL